MKRSEIRGENQTLGPFTSDLNSFSFRRSKEDKHLQFLSNVMEPVLALSLHKNDRTRTDLSIFAGIARTDLHAPTSAHHVIHLIFAMRLLRIPRPSAQHINASAHSRHAQKLKVEFPSPSPVAQQFIDMKEMNQGKEL